MEEEAEVDLGVDSEVAEATDSEEDIPEEEEMGEEAIIPEEEASIEFL